MVTTAPVAALVSVVAVLCAATTIRGVVCAVPAARSRRRLRSLGSAGSRRMTPMLWPAGRARVREGLAAALRDASFTVSVGTFASCLAAAVGVAAPGAFVLGGPIVASIVIGLVPLTAGVGLFAARGRRAQRVDEALPGLLDAVARALRAGDSLGRAVWSAARAAPDPLLDDLAPLVDALDHGTGLAAALHAWGAERPTRSRSLTVAALTLAVDTGGAPSGVVDGVAATLRDHAAVAREVRALSTQARASAVVIAVAPLGFAGLSAAADPRVGRFLFHSVGGAACLLAGLVLDLLGAGWMARLVRGRR